MESRLGGLVWFTWAEKEEPLARDELFSKTDVMILPSSAP